MRKRMIVLTFFVTVVMNLARAVPDEEPDGKVERCVHSLKRGCAKKERELPLKPSPTLGELWPEGRAPTPFSFLDKGNVSGPAENASVQLALGAMKAYYDRHCHAALGAEQALDPEKREEGSAFLESPLGGVFPESGSVFDSVSSDESAQGECVTKDKGKRERKVLSLREKREKYRQYSQKVKDKRNLQLGRMKELMTYAELEKWDRILDQVFEENLIEPGKKLGLNGRAREAFIAAYYRLINQGREFLYNQIEGLMQGKPDQGQWSLKEKATIRLNTILYVQRQIIERCLLSIERWASLEE